MLLPQDCWDVFDYSAYTVRLEGPRCSSSTERTAGVTSNRTAGAVLPQLETVIVIFKNHCSLRPKAHRLRVLCTWPHGDEAGHIASLGSEHTVYLRSSFSVGDGCRPAQRVRGRGTSAWVQNQRRQLSKPDPQAKKREVPPGEWSADQLHAYSSKAPNNPDLVEFTASTAGTAISEQDTVLDREWNWAARKSSPPTLCACQMACLGRMDIQPSVCAQMSHIEAQLRKAHRQQAQQANHARLQAEEKDLDIAALRAIIADQREDLAAAQKTLGRAVCQVLRLLLLP